MAAGGQIEWVEIGRARLALGDCRDVLPTLGTVDHIITDPPYSEGTHALHDARSGRARDGANRQGLGYSALTVEAVEELAGIFDGVCTGWVAWLTDADLAPFVRAAMQRRGRTTFPPLPYYHSGRSVRLAGDGPCSWTDWICVSRTKAQKKWGTLRGGYIAGAGWDDKQRMGGKPTRLMREIIADYSREDDVVCDPFMGAGTTGVAALQAGRRFVGMEIDPEAFHYACARLRAAIGEDPGPLFEVAA